MTNLELAKKFVNGATSGQNGKRTMFIEGDTLYSYGHHYALAQREGGEIYINDRKYSPTTTRQASTVMKASNYNALYSDL